MSRDTNLNDVVDWWNDRTNAQRNWAFNSYAMAQRHHATLVESGADNAKLEKAVWILEESRSKLALEDNYVLKQRGPRSNQHIYWLFTAGTLLILAAIWGTSSIVLWMVPFSSHIVGFVLRQLIPFFLAWIFIAAFVTVIIVFPKWNWRRKSTGSNIN